VPSLRGAVRAENVGGAEMQAARRVSLGVVSVVRGVLLRSVCRWWGSPLRSCGGAEVVPLSSSAGAGADSVKVCCQQVAQNVAEQRAL
jgi:hypothetical protein